MKELIIVTAGGMLGRAAVAKYGGAITSKVPLPPIVIAFAAALGGAYVAKRIAG